MKGKLLHVRHFYHVYASGAWAEPVREHAEALGASEFTGAITVGLVGPRGDRERAREMITRRFSMYGAPVPDSWVEADEGYEQVTLTALRNFARSHLQDMAILYAHTKGAHDNTEWNAAWRRSMTRRIVSDWPNCVRQLGRYELVGCHWLDPERYHTPPYDVASPFFGGNFWWALSNYVRRLPPLDAKGTRHDAETWIGLRSPRVLDLLPGWPSMRLCTS